MPGNRNSDRGPQPAAGQRRGPRPTDEDWGPYAKAAERDRRAQELQEQMAQGARDSIQEAGRNLGNAIAAGAVSAGLKIARPVAEYLEEGGNILGDLFGGLFDDDLAEDKEAEPPPPRRSPRR